MTRKGSVLLLVFAAGLAALVVWLGRGRRPAPLPAPAPGAVIPEEEPTVTRVLPPAPSEEAPEIRHATVVLPWEPAPTPSPTEPEPTEPPTLRPRATATPAVPECLAIRWSAGMSPVSIAHVLVDIRATNRCGRDLAPLDVWFSVAGYRQGALVQIARGHPFDLITSGGDAEVHIALPGSADWYDRIEVEVLPAAPR